MIRAWILLAAMLFTSDASAANLPLRTGYLTDLSGPTADTDGPGAAEAARMAIDDFGGQVLGRPVELLVADHQNKPDVGVAIARRWYDVDGVDLIGAQDVADATAGIIGSDDVQLAVLAVRLEMAAVYMRLIRG